MSESKGNVSEPKDGVEGSVPRATAARTWTVYILLCRDGSCYIGMTGDLPRRLAEHFTARGGHYTRCNPPVRLLYTEAFPTRAAAEARECQLKGWTRRKKEALIAGDLPRLKKLQRKQ